MSAPKNYLLVPAEVGRSRIVEGFDQNRMYGRPSPARTYEMTAAAAFDMDSLPTQSKAKRAKRDTSKLAQNRLSVISDPAKSLSPGSRHATLSTGPPEGAIFGIRNRPSTPVGAVIAEPVRELSRVVPPPGTVKTASTPRKAIIAPSARKTHFIQNPQETIGQPGAILTGQVHPFKLKRFQTVAAVVDNTVPDAMLVSRSLGPKVTSAERARPPVARRVHGSEPSA
jgi:hypothetical protein